MELGFDTIGNATVIAYDREPVPVTDPWIAGSAYFGSWGLSHPLRWPPSQFGDDWSAPLAREEADAVAASFRSIEHLRRSSTSWRCG